MSNVGYTLTAGGLLLLGGRLADFFGRKRLFLGGVARFDPDGGVQRSARSARS